MYIYKGWFVRVNANDGFDVTRFLGQTGAAVLATAVIHPQNSLRRPGILHLCRCASCKTRISTVTRFQHYAPAGREDQRPYPVNE